MLFHLNVCINVVIPVFTIICYHRFPFHWYFSSWTIGAPHHYSSFKFHIVALSLLCAMSLIQLFFREYIECFTGFVYKCFNRLVTIPVALWLLVWRNISYHTFTEFLYLDFYILTSFQSPFVLYSYLIVLLCVSINKFCLVFNYYIWPIGQNLSMCLNPWVHSTVISSCSHTALGMCEYQFSAVSMPNFFHIE
jgi:hypothetical protein